MKKKTPVHSTVVEEAPSSLEDAVITEERKTPVTQVVEVIEDDASATEKVPDLIDQKMEETREEIQEAKEEQASDEKRKELVDELFQKKSVSNTEVLPEISEHRSGRKNPILFWAIGIITACVVIGVAMVLFSGKKIGLPSIVVIPTPTPSPTIVVTPTPSPVEKKKDTFVIQVLNGGGVKGAATKMKTLLESKGYTVKDTGNTEEYSYEKTEIQVKSALQSYVPMIEADLKSTYTLGTSAATLEDSVVYDVRIIVGKN